MKRVAEQIADWLVAQDVKHVFTVTGGGAMFLNQGICGHPGIQSHFMHHEQACAMAAEGYARIAGKPALLMLTTGPGAINALNGVFGAFTDSIPLLVISGQVKRETCLDFHNLPQLRQLGDQEGPTIAMAKPVCKSAHLIRDPRDLELMLPEALAAAIYGRPGPAWLDIPLDIQSSNVQLDIGALQPPPAPRGGLSSSCDDIVTSLLRSNRPLILGGTGVRIAGVTERVQRLVEALGVPMVTAWAHDLIASDHPLFAGRPGTIGTRAGNFCLQNADFVLVLGSRLNIRQTSYNFDSFARNAWVAQVDIDGAEFTKPTVQPDLGIEADLGEFLEVLEIALRSVTLPSWERWASWCREIRERYHPSREHTEQQGGSINPYTLVARVFASLRADDIVVTGNASACILPFQIGQLRQGQRMFSNSGSASMGYDLPAALGAAFGGSGRRVICFAGDGSLQMNIQELQTLRTSGANVIVIVLNNEGYLSIRQTHENFFGRVIGATSASGVEFPDFAEVARAYGIPALRVASSEALPEFDTWLAGNGPLLLDVAVDPTQEFEPRIKSRVDAHGKFVTPELDDMYPFLDKAELNSVRESASLILSSSHKTGVDDA